MPKLKTHRGLKKRAKITASGKVMLGKAGKSHLMTGTTGKNVRKARGRVVANKADQRRLRRMLLGG